MKNSLLLPLAVACVGALPARATVVALWTFESDPPSASNQTAYTGIAPAVGTGLASGVHVGAGTDWSNPEGNGSQESFNANTWAAGDYFQFQTSLSTFQSVQLSWFQKGSGTGPKNFSLLWSTDGAVFNPVTGYVVGTNSWSTSTSDPASVYSVDLSSVTALDGASTGFFRLSSDTSASGGGTSRVDDFQISASELITPVPEVTTIGGIGFAMGFIGVAWRRCRAVKGVGGTVRDRPVES